MQSTVVAALWLAAAQAQILGQAPFDPEDWPATIDDSRIVHYVVTDFGLEPPSDTWLASALTILTGGDQVTEPIDIGGHGGLRLAGQYLNVRDKFFEEWADDEIIDILVQVYGDESVLGADGNPRNFQFLTGTLPELNTPVGGSIPAECRNRRWNWFLFRIVNGFRADGTHFVGSIPLDAQGNTSGGGVNGGTIRFQNVPGLKVRVVAFGEEGAFGEPDAINVCAPPDVMCPDEPETNLVSIDVNAGTSEHLEILDNGDQTVTFEDGVGPAGDLRRVVRPSGRFMNFGILDNYLGQPCNDPRAIKLCVEFYDDPDLIGAVFGPDAFATDDAGGTGFYPAASWHALAGSDAWVRRSWTVSGVNLRGVNTEPLTGGPRLTFEAASVAISKVEMALLRTGDHPLAGQDPLADCHSDPLICTDAYGNFAEFDLAAAVENGLAPGSSGGDQEMIIEEAGPAGDRRQAIRPALDDGTPGFTHQYLNFALVGEPFGPSSQPNAHLAICVTYYDDPGLTGATLRPQVYQVERGGTRTLGFASPGIAVSLEGTDEWRDAYWEIPEIKFNGVNQGPQAAARFVLNGKIFVTRVQYAVIRPCGPSAGVNRLEECNPICNDTYGNFAELDLAAAVENGLAPGSSGGDQEMIIDEAGPAGDRRQAIRPALDDGTPGFTHQYLNFALVDEPFGASSQPNAHLAICVTYYDDPELTGGTFRPQVYQVERGGNVIIESTPETTAATLEGSDQWREAYFEIPEIKFLGVNQGPQAAARFVLSGKIFFSRVRYAVIRSCGDEAGVNLLEDCKAAPAEVCDNGMDDDGDGDIDCADADCALSPSCTGVSLVRGDADANGSINLTDGIVILNFLFLGAAAPACLDAADTDDDGGARPSLTDAVIIFGWLFSGGPPPREPSPSGPTYSAADCGPDATEDEMDCGMASPTCAP
ncbi:MAG: hypothetical protein O7J95_20355 [Planctomycetota bacterium]|nr:hypothetical protein [Planctomycetota bacterium]